MPEGRATSPATSMPIRSHSNGGKRAEGDSSNRSYTPTWRTWAISSASTARSGSWSGIPANNTLIWGERGTGKSSVVKGLLARFAGEGLRMIEVRKQDLTDLPEIVEILWDRPERFVLFCDALSFLDDESVYLELKALLEGSLSARPDNVLVYATSNRRHLMPEKFADNTPRFSPDDDEIHPQETMEEKVSLSDRFGLSIGFYRITQDTYFEIVRHLVDQRGIHIDGDLLRRESLRWVQRASGRSGRVARQFVDDLEGRLKLGELP